MDSSRRVFDPLDLEIIDRIYETCWAHLEAREYDRDKEHDSELEEAVRKLIFALASPGNVDFDALCDKVLANMSDNAKPGDIPMEGLPRVPHL